MAAAVRVGTCSFADDSLVRHWYPRGLPAPERLPYYAERFSTVEVDSTFYRIPERETAARWAERTPEGFVVHVKAFGLMTRHPVPLTRVPPELRDELPVDAQGRVDRPSRAARAQVFDAFLDAIEPLRDAGRLGGILFQLPPYVVDKPASLDYLEWARGQLRDADMLVEFRHRSWFAEERQAELFRFLEERRMSYVVVDAPRLEGGNVPRTVVAATTPLAYVRFHGRNAATWNRRGGGAAERFDYLYSAEDLDGWIEPLRALGSHAQGAFALFNANNSTDGVAQGPAGATLLRSLLERAHVPTA